METRLVICLMTLKWEINIIESCRQTAQMGETPQLMVVQTIKKNFDFAGVTVTNFEVHEKFTSHS